MQNLSLSKETPWLDSQWSTEKFDFITFVNVIAMEFSIISCHGGWFPFVETKSQINPIVRFFELVSKYTKHLPLSLHNNADKAFTLFTLSAKKETNIHTSQSYIYCNYSCIEKLVPKRSQCFLLNRVSFALPCTQNRQK